MMTTSIVKLLNFNKQHIFPNRIFCAVRKICFSIHFSEKLALILKAHLLNFKLRERKVKTLTRNWRDHKTTGTHKHTETVSRYFNWHCRFPQLIIFCWIHHFHSSIFLLITHYENPIKINTQEEIEILK